MCEENLIHVYQHVVNKETHCKKVCKMRVRNFDKVTFFPLNVLWSAAVAECAWRVMDIL